MAATRQKRKPTPRETAPRKPAARKPVARKAPPRRAQRSLLSSRPGLPSFSPEAHHVDIAALALIAIGLFLGGVAYAHWTGGTLGDGAVRAMRFVLGDLGYAVPAALVATGGLILVRELRPPGRPMRTGALCLIAAITLALAAGTVGLGPGPVSTRSFWHPVAFELRGGVVGQGELWLISHLLSTLGAHVLAVFLFVAGVILVTGATLAGVLRFTGTGMVETGRALRRTTDDPRCLTDPAAAVWWCCRADPPRPVRPRGGS